MRIGYLEQKRSSPTTHLFPQSPLPRHLVLLVPIHLYLKQLTRQLRNVPTQPRQPSLYTLHRSLGQFPLPRIEIHARRRKQRFCKIRHDPAIPRAFLLPITQYLPLAARNHQPPLPTPIIRHARGIRLDTRTRIRHGKGLVDAFDGFDGGRVERLVGYEVVNLWGGGGGHGRVGYDDVAVLLPHWERRVCDVPGAGEPG
jgi:hypothetical protein